jgi:capsular polysaccharide biosynthesis protein
MTLPEFFTLLRRRGWIILLASALAAVSALAFSLLQTPIYQSTAMILVDPARPDFGLTQSAKTLLRSYVAWMQTRDNAERIINELQLDTTAETLLGQVTIDSDDSRFIIQIDVRHENGDTANDIARQWAELFVQWRDAKNQEARLEDRVKAALLDQPKYALYRPQKTINTLAGGILGALLGGVIIFVLEYLEAGVIRSRQDVERALGLSVMGAIPALEAARRKG